MGIDVYAKWRNQSKEDEKAQFTGFSTVAGNVGYLREAYHGGPYVTKFLLKEGFEDGGDGVRIPAQALRQRLPAAVLMALYRNKVVYGKGDPSIQTFEGISAVMKNVFETMQDLSHEEFFAKLTNHHIEYAERLIADRALPDYVLSFVEFVELCEKKEKEEGEAVMISVSY